MGFYQRDKNREQTRDESKENSKREEKAIVLDFLQNGYAFDRRPSHIKTPVAQALGTTWFSIIELVPKKDVFLQPYQEVYIGQAKRERIHHVNGKIPISKLTPTAKSELKHAIKEIILKNEQKFIDFFNKAPPLSTRMHSLELLPGVGKKHMLELLDKRKEEPFKSFDDIKNRVKLINDPIKLVVQRILSEIEKEGKDKHNLFT